MKLRESIKIFDSSSNQESILSDEAIRNIRDSVSDPTRLQPFIKRQIEQNDDLQEQIEQLQVDLQKQVKFTDVLETHIQQAKSEIESYQHKHKHDKLHNALISLFSALLGAIFGTVCTIMATRCGWL